MALGDVPNSQEESLEHIRKKRHRRDVVLSILLLVVWIAAISGGVYFLTRSRNSGFLFPCLNPEPLRVFHIHPWLRIWINNVNVTIPAAVGIRNPVFTNGIAGGGPNSCFEPLHTHDSSGVIHLASPDNTTQYTLGNFFAIWSETYGTASINGSKQPIVFDRTEILGYRIGGGHTLSLLIDEGLPTYQNSTVYESLVLNTYDFCNAGLGGVLPCSATAPSDPYPPSYPYGTGHTIVIYYK